MDARSQRNDTCWHEHMCTDDPEVSCNGEYFVGKQFPADKHVKHVLRKKRRLPSREARGTRRKQSR